MGRTFWDSFLGRDDAPTRRARQHHREVTNASVIKRCKCGRWFSEGKICPSCGKEWGEDR